MNEGGCGNPPFCFFVFFGKIGRLLAGILDRDLQGLQDITLLLNFNIL